MLSVHKVHNSVFILSAIYYKFLVEGQEQVEVPQGESRHHNYINIDFNTVLQFRP